jgi:protein SCO1/2
VAENSVKETIVLFALAACLVTADARGERAAPTARAPGPLQVAGFYLPEPLSLQAFSLLDHNARPFTAASLRSHWTLLFFGYTHCPDVCPTTLAQIRATKRLLAAQSPFIKLAVVFVSIDSQRDTSAELKQYVEQYGADFIGVGGSATNTDSFAQQFRVKYARSGNTGASSRIDHTSSVALVDPRARLRALLSVPLRPEAVAQDLKRIVVAEQSTAAPVTVASSDRGAK